MISKQEQQILLLFLGIFMFSCFTYIRFIHQRLPQGIPFKLSFWCFLILLFFIMTYTYLLYKIIKLRTSTTPMIHIYHIMQKMFEPLLILHQYLLEKKVIKIIMYNVLKFYILFVNKKKYDHYDDYTYTIFFVLPKIVVTICLVIDCFIFQQLYFIYSCVFILSMPLILRYLLFSSHAVRAFYCDIFNKHFIVEITSQDILHKSEDYDEKGFLIVGIPYYPFEPSALDYDDNSTLESGARRHKYLFAQTFINYQDWAIRFRTSASLLYEYKILDFSERKDVILLFESNNHTMTKKKADRLLCNLIQISILEDYIDTHTKDNIILGNYTRETNLFVYSLLLLCWLYIFFKSLHTLPENFIMFFLPAENNPFSDLCILKEIYDYTIKIYK